MVRSPELFWQLTLKSVLNMFWPLGGTKALFLPSSSSCKIRQLQPPKLFSVNLPSIAKFQVLNIVRAILLPPIAMHWPLVQRQKGPFCRVALTSRVQRFKYCTNLAALVAANSLADLLKTGKSRATQHQLRKYQNLNVSFKEATWRFYEIRMSEEKNLPTRATAYEAPTNCCEKFWRTILSSGWLEISSWRLNRRSCWLGGALSN